MSTIHEDISAVLGHLANGNFYLQALPQEEKLPCIVFRTLAAVPNMSLCGYSGQTEHAVVFECRARTFAEVSELVAQVQDTLETDTTLVKYRSEADGEEFEVDIGTYLEPVYFNFWYED